MEMGKKSIKIVESLEEQIAMIKRTEQSANSGYLTGYRCALSAVEGMIAEAEELEENEGDEE